MAADRPVDHRDDEDADCTGRVSAKFSCANIRIALYFAALCFVFACTARNIHFWVLYPDWHYDSIRFTRQDRISSLLEGRRVEFYPGATDEHRILSDKVVWRGLFSPQPVEQYYDHPNMNNINKSTLCSQCQIRVFFEGSQPVIFAISESDIGTTSSLRVYTGRWEDIPDPATFIISNEISERLKRDD